MNARVAAFKRAAAFAARACGLSMSAFMGQHGLQAFLVDADANNLTLPQIAAQALFQFCVSNGTYNHFTAGIVAAVEFLDHQMQGPATPQGKQQSYLDLKAILDQGGPYQAVEAWVNSYYH